MHWSKTSLLSPSTFKGDDSYPDTEAVSICDGHQDFDCIIGTKSGKQEQYKKVETYR